MGDLSSATIGTKVKIPGTLSCGFDIDTVTRVTSSQVCCGNVRLRKDDGLVVGSGGDSWNRRYASIAIDSDILQYRIACATSKLRHIKVTAENVDVIEALLRGEPVKNNECLSALKELREAEWMVSHDWGGDRAAVLAKVDAAIAACETPL